jgi:hypothetical protein
MTIQAALVGSDGTKGGQRAKSDGDLPEHADDTGLADFVTAVFRGMTVQTINGADREQLLRIAEMALRTWPLPSLSRI